MYDKASDFSPKWKVSATDSEARAPTKRMALAARV